MSLGKIAAPIRPTLMDAGLPHYFDLKAYQAKEEREDNLCLFVTLILCLILVYFYLNWVTTKFTVLSEGIGYVIFPGTVIAGGIQIFVRLSASKLFPDEHENGVVKYRSLLRTFDQAHAKWLDRVQETGLTYWREKRGVALEKALYAFFVNRNCQVQTTKISGDGGIDLIVNISGRTLWCQCKGHASPISVQVVREIAGVCSRGGGVPVVIAVNGYTAPAMQAAGELGVMLIDTPLLVLLAREQSLANLLNPETR